MQSIKQFFSYMNDISYPYVVLRNWDELPYDVSLGEHSDLDLLVSDFDHWKEIFPQANTEFPYPRVRMKVPIEDSYIYCDIRHIGDDYYPEDFQRAILETREYNKRGFYTPSPVLHRIALAYHAVHHKNFVSKDYARFLGTAKIEELVEALKKSNVGWIPPKDTTVGSFNGYWKGATSVVTKEDGKVVKEQTSYSSYDLIQNEYKKLTYANSVHFPNVYGYDGNKITIEDCGVPLIEKPPINWIDQLYDVLKDLKKNKITHRDIKLDNLMVKDGVVKLIDFGWSIFEEEVEEKQAPACLGFPNRPSYGFDDNYSMRCVIKQLEFALEENSVA